jgi:hypothetical protein
MPPSTAASQTISPGSNGLLVGLKTGYISRTIYASPAFGMHGYTQRQVTWEITYTSAPSAASVQLQGSIDGVNWVTLDTSTNVSGEVRYIPTDGAQNMRAFRVNAVSVTGTTTAVIKIAVL